MDRKYREKLSGTAALIHATTLSPDLLTNGKSATPVKAAELEKAAKTQRSAMTKRSLLFFHPEESRVMVSF
jgi:hypothetical protein